MSSLPYPNNKPFFVPIFVDDGGSFSARVEYEFDGARIAYEGPFRVTAQSLPDAFGNVHGFAVSRLGHNLAFWRKGEPGEDTQR